MTKAQQLVRLLSGAGVAMTQAGAAVVEEFLAQLEPGHVNFDGDMEAKKRAVEMVIAKGDAATVSDIRNVLRYHQVRRGAANYGIMGVSVLADYKNPDNEAAIVMITGGRKTYAAVQTSPHFRLSGVTRALQACAAPHTVEMKGNTGIPSAVKFGTDGQLSAVPNTERKKDA